MSQDVIVLLIILECNVKPKIQLYAKLINMNNKEESNIKYVHNRIQVIMYLAMMETHLAILLGMMKIYKLGFF